MILREFCRPLKEGEERAVETLLCAAFGGPDEARLVDCLRRDGVMAGEMVLPGPTGLIGYYALSWLAQPRGWLALAPVAVAPAHQGQGHGRRMIKQLAGWAQATQQSVVVLGDPEFYTQAGFSQARAQRLTGPYPARYLALLAPGKDIPAARLVYPRAFASET